MLGGVCVVRKWKHNGGAFGALVCACWVSTSVLSLGSTEVTDSEVGCGLGLLACCCLLTGWFSVAPDGGLGPLLRAINEPLIRGTPGVGRRLGSWCAKPAAGLHTG